MSDVSREYECGPLRVMAPPTCCLFCDHCPVVFWDYTHGPYAVTCELDEDTDAGLSGECGKFVDYEPIGDGE